MIENKSIDDKTWYELESVGDITTQLNTLFRKMPGQKIHESNNVFHTILTTDRTRQVKLYFTTSADEKNINRLFNNKAQKLESLSPLSSFPDKSNIDTAYELNFDPNAKITAPDRIKPEDGPIIEPQGFTNTSTEFEKVVGRLREFDHPCILSLLIGKYITNEEQTTNPQAHKNTNNIELNNSKLSNQIYNKFLRNLYHGRCSDLCYGKPKYIVRPIQLSPDVGSLKSKEIPINAYKSLAPNKNNVKMVEYDIQSAIFDIVYQKLPPEIVYRISMDPRSSRNGKSTIILVDTNVNSVLGSTTEV